MSFGILPRLPSTTVLGTMGFGSAEMAVRSSGGTAVPAAFFFLMLFELPAARVATVKKGRNRSKPGPAKCHALIGEENYETRA